MIEFIPFLMFALVSIGVFLMTSEHLYRVLFGLAILSQAANIFLLSRGRLVPGGFPFAWNKDEVSDPLAQALILTAIVISLASTAFAAVLFFKADQGKR
jgi:multicomponent Na+:H+ antiporter subunit C